MSPFENHDVGCLVSIKNENESEFGVTSSRYVKHIVKTYVYTVHVRFLMIYA